MLNRLVALAVATCLALSAGPALAAPSTPSDDLGDWIAAQVATGEPAVITIETAGDMPTAAELPLGCVNRALTDTFYLVNNWGYFVQQPVILVFYTAGIPLGVVTCTLPAVNDVLYLVNEILWEGLYGPTLVCAFTYQGRMQYFVDNWGYFVQQPEIGVFWFLATQEQAAFCMVGVVTGLP